MLAPKCFFPEYHDGRVNTTGLAFRLSFDVSAVRGSSMLAPKCLFPESR